MLLVSCGHAQSSKNTPATKATTVYYFHGKQRCATCLAIESLTKEVMNNDYAQQVKNGKVAFKVVDLSTPEGEKIGDKYEVAWSSLLIDHNGKVIDLTDMAFSYAHGQPEVFKSKLKGELNKILQ